MPLNPAAPPPLDYKASANLAPGTKQVRGFSSFLGDSRAAANGPQRLLRE